MIFPIAYVSGVAAVMHMYTCHIVVNQWIKFILAVSMKYIIVTLPYNEIPTQHNHQVQ